MSASRKALPAILILLLLLGAFSTPAAYAADGGEAPFFAETARSGPQSLPAADSPIDSGAGGAPADSPIDSGMGGAPVKSPAPQAPMPTQSGPVGCDSAQELIRLVNAEGAARIFLTADIKWDASPPGYSRVLSSDRPVTIEMGDHQIHVPSGIKLQMDGPFRFEGGCTKPLFKVEGTFASRGIEIAAVGDGAVAVSVEGGYFGNILGTVTAEGPGAVALLLDGQTELLTMRVTARGENAVGIRSTGPLELFLCSVKGDGKSVEAGAGELLLDGSSADPVPSGARFLRRRIAPSFELDRIGVLLEPGDDWQDPIFTNPEYPVAAIAEDGHVIGAEILQVQSVFSGVPKDLSRPGVYRCTYRPELPDWFPLEVPTFDVDFYVYDPGRQTAIYLLMFFPIDDGPNSGAAILDYHTVKDAQQIILWYSPDDGVTWQKADPSNVEENTACVFGLAADRLYRFRLEVVGGPMEGFSNTVSLSTFASGVDEFHWGDRDDDDRNEQGELPSDNVVPAPDDESGDSTVSSRPSGASAPGGGSGETPAPSRSSGAPVPAASSLDSAPGLPSPGRASAAGDRTPPAGANLSLTASELAAQRRANPGGITLIRNGLRATLPAGVLDLLPAGEPLYAQLETPETGLFTVRFWFGEQQAGPFDIPILLGVAYTPQDPSAGIACTNGKGDPVPAAWGGEGLWRFALKETGEYRIVEIPSPVEPAALAAPEPDASEAIAPSAQSGGAPPFWALALPPAGLAAAAFVLWRRRGGRAP